MEEEEEEDVEEEEEHVKECEVEKRKSWKKWWGEENESECLTKSWENSDKDWPLDQK